VELQVRLVKLLREERPARVLIGLVDPSHRAALERMLAGWPFSNHVVPGRALSVPQDTSLTPEALEAS